MVKDFSEYERERDKQNKRADEDRMNANQRAKANADELLEKIVKWTKDEGISGIETGIDQSNNVILRRSTGSLEISFREVGEPMIYAAQWEYSIYQKRTGTRSGGAISLEQTADNLDNSGLTDQQMAEKVMD